LESIRGCFRLYLPRIRDDGSQTKTDGPKTPTMDADLTDEEYLEEMYMSSLNFWGDIVEVAKLVDHS